MKLLWFSRISRLAVGTPVRSPGEETVVLPGDLTQEDHFDGQPLGTRAGTSVRYTFPSNGEYEFKLRLTRNRDEYIEGLKNKEGWTPLRIAAGTAKGTVKFHVPTADALREVMVAAGVSTALESDDAVTTVTGATLGK